MNLPDQFILSDLLKHRVRCDQGEDHGPGLIAWMHPPVHRLLGWGTRPSHLALSRHVWRLDQLRGIASHEIYVKGQPSITDQAILDRIPTLLNSEILNLNGQTLGSIADLVFEPKTGKIIYYLVSRSDPRIPGTSRWRLLINRILDQQPGLVSIDIKSLNDLPIERSSLRQDFLKRSRNWRDQLQDLSDQAGNRLEGWLEEPPWDDPGNRSSRSRAPLEKDPLEDWSEYFDNGETKDHLESKDEFRYSRRPLKRLEDEDDPWI